VANTIAANAITAVKIAASTITGDKIAGNTITGNLIAANTITGNNLVINTITGNLIAANTITANNIAASTITSAEIAANTITANQIAANTITATQISSEYVYAGNIVSISAELGNVSSPGYWLRYTDGSARFGGNVSIGNNLTVGNLISASSLNVNTVSFNNLVPGTVPAPVVGNLIGNTTVALPNAAAYDWLYTGGTNRGYVKTVAELEIEITPAMVAGGQIEYRASFNCDIQATGISGGSSGAVFYIFTNYQGGNTATTYAGNAVPLLVYTGSTPIPAGAQNNPGSLIGPQFGRPILPSGGGTSYTGPFQFSVTSFIPFGGSTGNFLPILGSTAVIGVALTNENITTPVGNVGNITLSNVSFNVLTV